MGSGTIGSLGALRAPIPETSHQMPVAARGLDPRAFTGRTVVRQQESIGSCVAFAYATALNIIQGSGLMVSPLALYWYMRVESGFSPDADSGCFLEPAVRALVKRGAGSEVVWPYNIADFKTQPDIVYRMQAMDHRVSKFYRATTALQAKSAISLGLPVVTAFDVPPNFDQVGLTGKWHDDGGSAIGGHAVCIVGYDDHVMGGAFLMQNSWGNEWGAQHPQDVNGFEGYFWVGYGSFDGTRFWDSIVVQTFDMEAGR